MKFQGSKIVVITCRECGSASSSFKVYLYKDEEYLWQTKESPDDWFVEDEEELNDDDSIWGYCPKHKES